MDYSKHYILLIERAINRILPENTYTEEHHIVPRCVNIKFEKEKGNLVALLPEEHYVAHQLLYKMYENTKYAFGLLSAITKLSGTNENKNNKCYGWVKRKLSMKMSERIVSDETKKKLSISMKRIMADPKRRELASKTHKGKYVSEEAREKSRIANTGRKHTEETKRKISYASINMSEESKRKRSDKLRGRKRGAEISMLISERNRGRIATKEARKNMSLSHLINLDKPTIDLIIRSYVMEKRTYNYIAKTILNKYSGGLIKRILIENNIPLRKLGDLSRGSKRPNLKTPETRIRKNMIRWGITNDMVNDIIQKYTTGKSITAIIKESGNTNLTYKRVRAILKRQRISTNLNNR